MIMYFYFMLKKVYVYILMSDYLCVYMCVYTNGWLLMCICTNKWLFMCIYVDIY